MDWIDNGFIIQREIIPKSTCQKAVDYLFAYGKRNLGTKFPTGEVMNSRTPYKWRNRCIRSEDWVWTDIVNLPEIRGTVENLIDTVYEPNNSETYYSENADARGFDLRGIYTTLPGSPGGKVHVDGHRFDCGVVVLLDDVPETCGCFSVYPGTHQSGIPKGDLDAAQIELLPSPFLFSGCTGDVIFWHPALVHQEQPNTSDKMRITLFHDWAKHKQ